jgi:hypothetical protein
MFIQGYLLARPVPQHELVPLLSVVKERARELLISAGAAPAREVEPSEPQTGVVEAAERRARGG